MIKLRHLATTLALASFFSGAAQAVTPGFPSLSMNFELDGETGKIVGTVTAPEIDSEWQALPSDSKLDLRVIRECYALGQSNITVFTATDVAAGETRSFTDTAEPTWQYGYDYTYKAFASLDGQECNYPGYSSCSPGFQFNFAYNGVTATQTEENGKFTVTISAIIPDKTSGWPAEPLEIDMTSLELYRIEQSAGNPQTETLISSIPNPVKGETYQLKDEDPKVNAVNRYLVKCVSKFGETKTEIKTFVGYDVPAAPYSVQSEMLSGGGCKISWTAPSQGINYGQIKPEETFYNVYRVWGDGDDDRCVIASGLRETEYIDYGTDMSEPRKVYYNVVAANDLGTGGNRSSSYSFNVNIGPQYNLPFVENFDEKASKIWDYAHSNYYAQFEISSYLEYGDNKRVNPVIGSGMAYVDFTYQYAPNGANASMTSYHINLTKAQAPYLTFSAYMVPGCDVVIKLQARSGEEDFVDLQTVNVGECTTEEWKSFTVNMAEFTGKENVEIRFYTTYTSQKGPAVIDAIQLIDYPAVGNINIAYDPEASTATLTWENPSTEYAVVTSYEGFVDGISKGTVEMPWVFTADEYAKPYVITVKAHYGDIIAPESSQVTVSVPRPAITEFTIDDHTYSIVKNDSPDVKEVIVKKYNGTTVLYHTPQFVKFDDVSYKVIGIGDGAYSNNKTIASVNMSETIATVGAEAFSGCTTLTAVAFGNGLKKIESKAFAGCSSLSSVTFVSQTVPEVAADAFEGISKNCTGKCPEGMEDDYSSVTGLEPIKFKTLGSGIETILREADSVEYYGLDGVRLSSPEAGRAMIVRVRMGDGTFRTFRIL